MFGVNSGTIQNVGVVDSYFNGSDNVGGVCGRNIGTITNCYNTGTVSGSDNVGGVNGYNSGGNVTNCYENIRYCRR
ncbi:MAG: GLUG motif-containing protein [Porcipelethomonas sp.]